MELCRTCFSDDEVVRSRDVDGVWWLTCSRTRKHADGLPYSWPERSGRASDGGAGAVTLEQYLGPLRQCLRPGEPFVEYGVVEWRFRSLAAPLFEELVAEHGHRVFDPRPQRRMASSYLSQALSRLVDRDQAARLYGQGTGLWRDRSDITYWAALPAPPTASRLSWADLARDESVDPELLARPLAA